MSIKTLALAFAAGLLASQAYAELQQGSTLYATASDSHPSDDEFADESIAGGGLSLNGGARLRAENFGSGVFGEAPDDPTAPYRADDGALFGSDTWNTSPGRVPSVPDLTRGA